MRILQIAESYGATGGLEKFIHEFSKQIVARGWETTVIALEVGDYEHWGNTSFDVLEIENSIGAWVAFANQYRTDLVVWHTGGTTAEIVEELSKIYPTVSTVHGAMCPSGVRLFRDRDEVCTEKSGIGCIARWYGRQCGTNKSPKRAVDALRLHKSVMGASLHCMRIYAVSQSVQSQLETEGVPSNKIRVFDNTLGTLGRMPPMEPIISFNPFRLLFVGRLVYEKGVQYLIRATHMLLKMGHNVECIIVGDGWYRERLEQLTYELGIINEVQFKGNVPGYAIGTWYENCQVVVVPSIWPDPAPLVVPEARSKGKPVVVTDTGGLPEWAEFTDGIHVARHGNVQHLADTILRTLTTDPANSQTKAASKRVEIISDIEGFYFQYLITKVGT